MIIFIVILIIALVLGAALSSFGVAFSILAILLGGLLYYLADRDIIHLEIGLGLLMWSLLIGGIFGLCISISKALNGGF